MIYIYYLICPESMKIRYVGKSKNPKTRFKKHIKDATKTKTTTNKKKWIIGLLKKGKQPILKIDSSFDNEEKAREEETKCVLKHINTVYNIHLPSKKMGTVEAYKKTKKMLASEQKEYLKKNK